MSPSVNAPATCASVIPYPASVVGLLVIPLKATAPAVPLTLPVTLPVKGPYKIAALLSLFQFVL